MSFWTRGALAAAAALVFACSSSSGSSGVASITVDDFPHVPALVVFHHPDGTVQCSSTIDPGATVRATIIPGSLVTIARRYDGGGSPMWFLQTIAGLEPGDAIRFPAAGAGSYPAGTATVVLPACSGTSRYRVDLGCGSSEWTTSVADPLPAPIYEPACGTTVDVLATALDPNGVPSAYAAALGVPVSRGSASATVGTWEPAATTSLALTNAPPGTVDVRVVLEPRRNGVLFTSSVAGAYAPLAGGGSTTQTFVYPAAFATSARRTVTVDFSTDRPVQSSGQLVDEVSYAPATLDLSASLPPRLSNLRVTSVAGSLTAAWEEAASDTSLDAITLSVSWSGFEGDYTWSVLMPPGATSFAFPLLPAELAGSLPPDGAIFGIVTTLDLADTDSYRAFRRQQASFQLGVGDAPSSLRYSTAWAW